MSDSKYIERYKVVKSCVDVTRCSSRTEMAKVNDYYSIIEYRYIFHALCSLFSLGDALF